MATGGQYIMGRGRYTMGRVGSIFHRSGVKIPWVGLSIYYG